MSHKIVNAMKTGTYETQYGEDDGTGKKVMVKYTVQFEGSDDTVELSQKPSTAAPKAGDEMDGTIETTQYGKRFKKAPGASGGFTSNKATDPATRASIEAQTSLNAAVTAVHDYYAFMAEDEGKVKLSEYVSKIVQVSKLFANSLAGKDVGIDTAKVVEVMPGAEEAPEALPDNDTLDLSTIPF